MTPDPRRAISPPKTRAPRKAPVQAYRQIAVPLVERKVEPRRRDSRGGFYFGIVRGVVDQNVNASVSVENFLKGRLDGFQVRNVCTRPRASVPNVSRSAAARACAALAETSIKTGRLLRKRWPRRALYRAGQHRR